MANHNDLGVLGEEIAVNFLLGKGYLIEALNWRTGHLEIDIIAHQNGILVFLEVKTRKNTKFGFPEANVTTKKEKLLFEAAANYMYSVDYEQEFRFDIIAITFAPELEIMHFEDAFFPNW